MELSEMRSLNILGLKESEKASDDMCCFDMPAQWVTPCLRRAAGERMCHLPLQAEKQAASSIGAVIGKPAVKMLSFGGGGGDDESVRALWEVVAGVRVGATLGRPARATAGRARFGARRGTTVVWRPSAGARWPCGVSLRSGGARGSRRCVVCC